MTDAAAFTIAAGVSAWLDAPLWVTILFAVIAVLEVFSKAAKS
jgi:hypothetical protein